MNIVLIFFLHHQWQHYDTFLWLFHDFMKLKNFNKTIKVRGRGGNEGSWRFSVLNQHKNFISDLIIQNQIRITPPMQLSIIKSNWPNYQLFENLISFAWPFDGVRFSPFHFIFISISVNFYCNFPMAKEAELDGSEWTSNRIVLSYLSDWIMNGKALWFHRLDLNPNRNQ